MKKILSITAFVLLMISVSFSATYYVDNSGSDNNSGLSSSSPWKTIAKVNSISFAPGDQILFKRGGVWYETIQVKRDNILYGAYGTGALPVLDGQLTRLNNIYMSGRSGVTVQNLELRNNGGSGSLRVQNSSNIIVENLVVYATAKGIFFETSRQCTVRNNKITTPTYINTQTDGIYSQRNIGNVYENNHIVISNTAVDQHNDGIQCYLDSDIIARGNYIEQNNTKTGNSQGIYATNNSGRHIWYNNIINTPNIMANSLGFKNLESIYTGTVEVYQNTVITKGGNGLCVENSPNFIAKNNIFISNGSTYVITIKGTVNNFSNLNYNVYFNKGTTQASAYLTDYGGTQTITQLRSRGAEAKGIYGNPQLNSDWVPADGSIVVDKGLNLPSPYNVDKIGTLRPFNLVSDMGAIEKKWGVLAPPAAPGSLSGNTVETNKISIKWNRGCESEDGFRIERRLSGGVWAEAGTVGKNILLYEDTGLESSTTYIYRVRAYNTAGSSAYSNECTVATSSVTGTSETVNIDLTDPVLVYGAYSQKFAGSLTPLVWVLDSKKSYIEYSLTITLPGDYYVEGRFYHGSRGAGSFNVQINGGSKTTISNNKLIGTWSWDYKVFLGTLQPGTYTIRISNTKPSSDSYLDLLRVTGSSSSNQPVVTGTDEINGVTSLSNYPNPFNPQTTIRYSVPSEGRVTMKVYDILGNVVSELVDDHKISGTYEAVFNGSKLSSGIYFLELRTPEAVHLLKMNMVK